MRTLTIVLVVYIDDCTIAASESRLMNDFKTGLSRHGEIADPQPSSTLMLLVRIRGITCWIIQQVMDPHECR